jgi:hypothetical protein
MVAKENTAKFDDRFVNKESPVAREETEINDLDWKVTRRRLMSQAAFAGPRIYISLGRSCACRAIKETSFSSYPF